MKLIKNTENLSKRQLKDRANNWKIKAIERGSNNIRLRKENKALRESRDKLNKKYQLLKDKRLFTQSKAKKHHYPLEVVCLVLHLYIYGSMSLRSVRHSLNCMFLFLGLNEKLPSHTSIRNWLCKSGLYRIKKTAFTSGDYILFVDESISYGSEKMLLILGVHSHAIDFTRPLSHQDMEVLYIAAGDSWKSDSICSVLEEISVNKQIIYVVSDEGHNLKKAYKALNYTHIEDCTHILAKYLKHIYKQSTEFESFCKLIGSLRKKWNLSKLKSPYMPPKMRGKMRFANIFPCVHWANNMIENWNSLDKQIQEELIFLKQSDSFIKDLVQIEKIFKIVCTDLKSNGYSQATHKVISHKIGLIKGREKVSVFKENCECYLTNLSQKAQALEQSKILCSSDIIESYFGKFKAKVNPNRKSGLTEFIFTMATFSQNFTALEVKKAMEAIQCKDLVLKKNLKNVA